MKDKSEDSDESTSSSGKKEEKKKKSNVSSDESTSPNNKKEKSDESASSSKKEKEKETKDESTSWSRKEKKKEKSDDESSKAEKPDEEPTPVDVSTTTGEYVTSSGSKKSNEEKPREQLQGPATKSSSGQSSVEYVLPKKEAPSASIADPYAAAKHVVKPASSSTPADAYESPDAQPASPATTTTQQVPLLDGSPDQQPPTTETDAPPNNKPKVTVESLPEEPATTTPHTAAVVKAAVNPVVKSFCAKTDTPDLCESSIAGLPSPAPAHLDGAGVLRLAMEAVRLQVVEAINAATDRMHAPGTDAVSRNALNTCLETYDDMKAAMATVGDALDAGDIGTAATYLDSVSTDVTTCEDGFTERQLPPLMADHDDFLAKLCSNLLAIGTAIKS
ncbi:hypothetical protein PR202_ga22726 [Eleusine coracana subsp. coracana]|uniref:Pectinesterase inhibitor domain-containing protein n=1 Tax=Eleusine coracana subsp. coracana TaxID=191504 RepID=A0AAV5D4A3_ELECO|nr:hypothetical protein PR202_ga22726 [Eleusine coracana subsp. coracana]